MAIADLFGTTFSGTVTGDHSSGTSTITFFTPSNRVIQAAVSVADVKPGCFAEARVERVNIPGFGDVELHGTTTVRWIVNSVTFSLSLQTILGGSTTVIATVLVGVYSA